jgi:transcriptional regulator with XRE-family HTH domain
MNNSSKLWYSMSDPAILKVLGNFIRRARLNQNRTQQDVSEAAGINRSTLVQIEQGNGSTLLSFIAVLRTLEQLHLLDVFEVKQELSPLQLAEIEMKNRQRASKKTPQNNKPESAW